MFLFCGEVIADFKEALETIYVQNDFENLHLNGEKVYLSKAKHVRVGMKLVKLSQRNIF